MNLLATTALKTNQAEMKKTVQVNIGGMPFHVDEDAYQRLQVYLSHIRQYYINTPEGAEILSDIEARIAEILQDKISKTKQAVSFEDISTVILILGEPEQFDTTEQPTEGREDANRYFEDNSNESHQTQDHMERRRIFRDTDHAKLGGVCAGLAAYVGVVPIVVRILFIVATLFYGSSLLVYLLLWAMIPQANTRAEKMEMHGEPIDISNIERRIKDEFNNLKKNVGI